MTALTLADALAALGYAHRPAAHQGHREVLDATGAMVCTGTAAEAWLWLHAQETAPALLAAQTEDDPT